MKSFKDKVVLITGAGKGAGREVALAFAQQEAMIAVNDITPINLDQTVADIQVRGVKVMDYVFDVSKKMPVTAMINQVVQDWGRIDFLVNCASVDPGGSIIELDEWDWRRTVDVNLTAAFLMTQAVANVMIGQGEGVILNIVTPPKSDYSEANQAALLASKAGIIGFSRAAASELAEYNIRVNVLLMKNFVAAMTRGEAEFSKILSSVQTQNGVQRSRNLPEWVLYLCSDQAAAISGQEVIVDEE